MTRLFVCPPDFFGIEYEINPWMRLSNRVDHEQAKRQWFGLMNVLQNDLAVELERLAPVAGLPDLVFTANAGVVVGRTAVVSRFRYPERQREEAHFETWFRKKDFEVMTLEKGLFSKARMISSAFRIIGSAAIGSDLISVPSRS